MLTFLGKQLGRLSKKRAGKTKEWKNVGNW